MDGLQFATARGWEDLSELICAYEKLGLQVDRTVVEQYIQMPAIARDFANYLMLYYKYQKTYHVDGILRGEWEAITESELRAAAFDERLSVLGLLISRLSDAAGRVRAQDDLTERLYEVLLTCRESDNADAVLAEEITRRHALLKLEKDAGRLDKARRNADMRLIRVLERYRSGLETGQVPADAVMSVLKGWFGEETAEREKLADTASGEFDNAFRFLERTFGDSQELVMFVTELTAGADTSWFIENFGCDAYYRHNKELLFNDARRRLTADIAAARKTPADI